MKILVVSDVHYDKRVFKGVDESRAWPWLLEVVDFHKPNVLLGGGDWGYAISETEFQALLEKTLVLTIYGNHDNLEVLQRLTNKLSENRIPVLMEDARIHELGGLKIAGINGIISRRRRKKKGVPRKKPEEYLVAALRLRGKQVDILLIHEAPYLPQLFPFLNPDHKTLTVLKAIEEVKPRLVVNGHMHYGGYKTHLFPWGTCYVYIDSSQQERHYLVIEGEEGNLVVSVWRDSEILYAIEIGECH